LQADGVVMKRLVLLLPLAATACGDGVQTKLDRCRDDIRAELEQIPVDMDQVR
jgi:hypothetical protein